MLEKGKFMKYKASLIVCAVIIVALALSFFVNGETVVSELENRNMTTFKMILDPVDDIDPDTGEKSVLYNADKSIPDRLEDALKDQIFIRNLVVLNYTNLESKLSNLYSGVTKVLSAPFKQETPIEDDVTDETEPPVTVPDDGFPDEYYDLAEEVEETPTELDFSSYPGYGFARLEASPIRSYTYTSIGSFALFNGTDYVGAKPTKSAPSKDAVSKHVAQYERLLKKYPNLKFYSYFVTQIQDTPWFYDFYGAYPDKHETIAQYLPEYVTVGRLTFKDFADYQACYYKSDHHWGYKGSERGYQDVYAMMADDLDLSPMKYPIKTWNFSELYGVEYRGSRANNLRDAYSAYDEFIVYEYDLGERETFVLTVDNYTREIPVTMGLWEYYKVGNINKSRYFDHYINFYGRAYDSTGKQYADSETMFVIKNNNGAEHSLLLVCDSTQRPYRDVLGSHFKNVVTLDYRIITKVPVDYLIEKYGIDTILCGGQSFAWSGSSSYLFKFSDNFGK